MAPVGSRPRSGRLGGGPRRPGRSRPAPPTSRSRFGRGWLTAPASPGPPHLRALPASQPSASARAGPLSEAIEESESCGGGRFAAQARTELRASGGRRPRQSSKQLSAQERSVTALAIDGASNEEIANRLFISLKTVEHHLTSAYSKLGIRSRKELKTPCRHRRAQLSTQTRNRRPFLGTALTRLTGLPSKSWRPEVRLLRDQSLTSGGSSAASTPDEADDAWRR